MQMLKFLTNLRPLGLALLAVLYATSCRFADNGLRGGSGENQIADEIKYELPPLSLSLTNAEVSEGEIAKVTLTLSRPSDRPIPFTYRTQKSTAWNNDFTVAENSSAVIPPGITSFQLEVPTVSDNVPEISEKFNLEVTSATGAKIQNSVATVTINDDDDNTYTVYESDILGMGETLGISSASSKNLVAVATTNGGIMLFDTSNESAPTHLGNINTSSFPFIATNHVRDVEFIDKGNYLLVATWNNFEVWRVPTTPSNLSSWLRVGYTESGCELSPDAGADDCVDTIRFYRIGGITEPSPGIFEFTVSARYKGVVRLRFDTSFEWLRLLRISDSPDFEGHTASLEFNNALGISGTWFADDFLRTYEVISEAFTNYATNHIHKNIVADGNAMAALSGDVAADQTLGAMGWNALHIFSYNLANDTLTTASIFDFPDSYKNPRDMMIYQDGGRWHMLLGLTSKHLATLDISNPSRPVIDRVQPMSNRFNGNLYGVDIDTSTRRVYAVGESGFFGIYNLDKLLGAYEEMEPIPQLNLVDASVTEGQVANVTVLLDQAAHREITLDWTTVAGTATANQDFTPASGILKIPAGTRTLTLEVNTLSDEIADDGETFTIQLSNQSWGSLNQETATITIHD